MKQIGRLVIMALVLVLFTGHVGFAAYNHQGDTDSVNFRTVYPAKVGTKLDSCTLCHCGGSDIIEGKPTTYGSCQWCHYKYGYTEPHGNIEETLNPYGKDYLDYGRSSSAIGLIANFDSDNDGYTNANEIADVRYPGDANDDPSKVPALSRVMSLKQLEKMPQHSQFLLMNASKSDDTYTRYSGVALENLIKAFMLNSATGIRVYSPDGFAQDHPFNPASKFYHVFGTYPPGTFWYNERADIAIYPPDPDPYPDDPPDTNYATGGWCDYSAPEARGRKNGSPICNPEGLKLLLAFKRHAQYLEPGVLNLDNKLDGEGPFRVVPPQKTLGKPDQRSNSVNQSVIWPYDKNADHNAGSSSRTVTMIKVTPMPSGTTDINTYEAGWPYVDEKKVVIYGAINPHPEDNLNTSLDSLIDVITDLEDTAFKVKSYRSALVNKIEMIKKQVADGAYAGALTKLKEDVLQKTDGYLSGAVDGNDWINDLEVQQQLGSEIQTICIMLALIGE